MADSLESNLGSYAQAIEKNQHIQVQNSILPIIQQINAQQHATLHQNISNQTQVAQQQQQQVALNFSLMKQQWDNVKQDLELNILPDFSADSKSAIELIVWNINSAFTHVGNPNQIGQSQTCSVISNLRLLGHFLVSPPKLIDQPAQSNASADKTTPKEVIEIFKQAEDDINKQIGFYSGAGWAALLFGLLAAGSAVIIPFRWDIPSQVGAFAFVAALLARLLAIGVLVYIASILLQRHKDMVHLAARTRQLRAHMKMTATVPFFTGDASKVEALTSLLKEIRERADDKGSDPEKGFFVTTELVNSLAPLISGLTAKK